MSKARAYLDLVRLPNLFTAIADVLAGFAFAGGGSGDWPMLVLLCLSSVCLYAGGVTLNDVCDVRVDALERPNRPIPSGRITVRAASSLCVTLLIAGVVLAMCASVRSGVVASALVVSIVLYDAVLKRTWIAPGFMGLCRGLNLFLPLAALGVSLENPTTFLPSAILWVYVMSVTTFARGEAVGGRGRSLTLGVAGVCLSVVGLVGLHWAIPEPHDAYLSLVILLTLIVAYYGVAALRQPDPASIQRAVKVFVVSLIGLDASIAWASRGLIAGAVVACLLIPTVILGSRRVALRVT